MCKIKIYKNIEYIESINIENIFQTHDTNSKIKKKTLYIFNTNVKLVFGIIKNIYDQII